MKLHVIIGTLAGLLIGFWQAESWVAIALFGLAGLLGGWIAGKLPRASERLYWLFLFITIILLTMAWFGVGIGRLVMAFPLVLMLSYFVARIFWRFLGAGKRT